MKISAENWKLLFLLIADVRGMTDVKKNQIEILELKNAIT